MTLAQAGEGQVVLVKRLDGGFGFRRRLMGLGIYPDQKLMILKSGILGGPILVKVGESGVAIGRGMANKIEVEMVKD